ncbi:MAG TPA: Gldg family protein, partial [Planctomycetota bacterium]|nr:Gldg family protein [Planctomycetota bacterium]
LTEGEGGRGPEMEVYLGLAVTCGLDEVVVPFIYRAHSPEYEVTRSLRAVMNAKRAKIGILSTDVKLFGGFDFQSMRHASSWELVDELKRLYEVVSVSADAPIAETMDVLIVPMVSSLPQSQLDNLFAYAKQGKPLLLFDDPFTAFDGGASGANEMKGGRQAMMGGAPPEPKGDFKEFYAKLGIAWDSKDIVWDHYKPNPKRRDLDPEIVFVGKHNGAAEPFAQKSKVTAKLQEVAFIFGGAIKPGDKKGIEVTALVHAGRPSGIVSYNDLWGHSFMGRQMNPDRPHVPSAMIEEPVLAARVQGKDGDVAVDAIVVADLDVASPLFFRIRREEWDEFQSLENIEFVLNCVDALAREEAMIDLRSHRPRHRTIETVEAVKRASDKKVLDETKSEEDKAKKALETAQKQFDEAVEKIKAREDLDVQSKQIMVASVHEAEQRKFEVQKRRIEDDKKAAIRKSKQEASRQVKSIQKRIKAMALLLPPVPALLIAILALVFRIRRELEARR